MADQLISLLLQTLPVWVVAFVVVFGYVVVQVVRIQKQLLQMSEQQSSHLKDKFEAADKATSVLERALARQDRELELLRYNAQGQPVESLRAGADLDENIVAISEPATPLALPPAPEETRFARAYKLLRTQNYDEGMRLIRAEAAEGSSNTDAVELIAMGQYIAWDAGASRALADLENTVEDHPNSSGARLWLAYAYSETGRIDEAIQHARVSLDSAKTEAQHASSIRALARYLVDSGNRTAAVEVLREGLRKLSTGADRAGMAAHLADVYAQSVPPDNENASAFYELALRDAPGDNNLRFKVAYWYGEITMYSTAFAHYNEILRRDPTYGSVLNNLGVAAKHLNMPIRSVGYYRKAQANGESLPSANLASLYLSAGFVEDAQRELDHGRMSEEPHRSVSSTTGEIARLQEHEDKIFASLDSTTVEWKNFSISLAAALLAPDLSPEISGFYSGVPSNLQLSVAPGGKVTGTFFHYGDHMAHLVGSVTGRCLRFTWESVPTEPNNVFSMLSKSAGHGLLIVEDGSPHGYFAPGEPKLSEVWSVLRTRWMLSGQIQPEAGQLPAGQGFNSVPVDDDPDA